MWLIIFADVCSYIPLFLDILYPFHKLRKNWNVISNFIGWLNITNISTKILLIYKLKLCLYNKIKNTDDMKGTVKTFPQYIKVW